MGVTDDFVAWCESKGADLSAVELRDATDSPACRLGVDIIDGASLGKVDADTRGRGVFSREGHKKGESNKKRQTATLQHVVQAWV